MKYIDKILTCGTKSLFKVGVDGYDGWFEIKDNIKFHICIRLCRIIMIARIMFR